MAGGPAAIMRERQSNRRPSLVCTRYRAPSLPGVVGRRAIDVTSVCVRIIAPCPAAASLSAPADEDLSSQTHRVGTGGGSGLRTCRGSRVDVTAQLTAQSRRMAQTGRVSSNYKRSARKVTCAVRRGCLRLPALAPAVLRPHRPGIGQDVRWPPDARSCSQQQSQINHAGVSGVRVGKGARRTQRGTWPARPAYGRSSARRSAAARSRSPVAPAHQTPGPHGQPRRDPQQQHGAERRGVRAARREAGAWGIYRHGAVAQDAEPADLVRIAAPPIARQRSRRQRRGLGSHGGPL